LYNGREVLEFGGGQSSLWWAGRADRVVTLEGDKVWHDKISERMPGNVDLFLVSMADMASCVADVRNVLKNYGRFDVIVVDGLYRAEMMKIAAEVLSADGAIVCDNAEGYGVDQVFKDSDLRRVDFFGYAPGVVNPHCTSMLFGQDCFLLSPAYPIPDPAIAD
jgi:predicted O-methyltransferase YrrM